jgi:hypothetical protein
VQIRGRAKCLSNLYANMEYVPFDLNELIALCDNYRVAQFKKSGEPIIDVSYEHTQFMEYSFSSNLVKLRDDKKQLIAIYLVRYNESWQIADISRIYTPDFIEKNSSFFNEIKDEWDKKAIKYINKGNRLGACIIGSGYYVRVMKATNWKKITKELIIYQNGQSEAAWGNTGSFIDDELKDKGIDYVYDCGRLD